MAAVSFGSFGDIVAAVGLIKKTVYALRDAHGATADFQQTISFLDLLEIVVADAQSYISVTPSSETAEKIRFCSLLCRSRLSGYWKSIEKFKHHLY